MLDTARRTRLASGLRAVVTTGALALAVGATSVPASAQVRTRSPGRIDGMEVPRALPSEQELGGIRVAPELRDLAERLDSPLYVDREDAFQTLLEMSVDVRQVCALLAEAETTPEQRFRLLRVLRERLVGTPRGALGISMNPRQANERDPGGVEILDLIPGLPAERVLLVDDRITHIDGNRLRSRNDLVILVQSRLPGDVVSLAVSRPQRDEQGRFVRDEDGIVKFDDLEIDLALGSLEELRDPETGRLQTSQILRDTRAAEADEAERRYAPRPRTIRIREDAEGDFSGRTTTNRLTGTAVDDHRLIVSLKRDLERVASGRMRRSAALLDSWEQRLQMLYDEVDNRDLSEQKVEFLRRVIARFVELTNQ